MHHRPLRFLPLRRRPLAYYAVVPGDGFHWLVRRSAFGELRISPYTDAVVAQISADYLNTLVRWEASA